MNRIVLEHYPASKLPADVRGDIKDTDLVTLEVKVEMTPARREKLHKDLKQLLSKARTSAKPVTWDEAVARVRELRDEWDD